MVASPVTPPSHARCVPRYDIVRAPFQKKLRCHYFRGRAQHDQEPPTRGPTRAWAAGTPGRPWPAPSGAARHLSLSTTCLLHTLAKTARKYAEHEPEVVCAVQTRLPASRHVRLVGKPLSYTQSFRCTHSSSSAAAAMQCHKPPTRAARGVPGRLQLASTLCAESQHAEHRSDRSRVPPTRLVRWRRRARASQCASRARHLSFETEHTCHWLGLTVFIARVSTLRVRRSALMAPPPPRAVLTSLWGEADGQPFAGRFAGGAKLLCVCVHDGRPRRWRGGARRTSTVWGDTVAS